jgi:hypothetical protein
METTSIEESASSSPAVLGGKARMQRLSGAERTALAGIAANARWGKDKRPGKKTAALAALAGSSLPEAPPAPAPESPKRRKKSKPLPKAFGSAHNYAEKRLAEAIKERTKAMYLVAELNAEIPSLVQIINALKNTQNAVTLPELPADLSQALPIPPQTAYPPRVSRAQGGAIGVDLSDANDDEDRFLKDSIVSGGEWR